MGTEKKKPRLLLSDRFGMVIDEQRQTLLHLVVQIAFQTGPLFTEALQKYGIERCLEEFMAELSDKEHGMGWCKDPNCTLKNGPDDDE